MKPAAFSGNYADFKLIKTRSVCQAVIEIPIERAGDFIKAFGVPQPATEIPVALALLNVEAVQQPVQKRAMLPSTQAALTCKEPRFWAFVRELKKFPCEDEESAAEYVRAACSVTSRSDIYVGSKAEQRWNMLLSAYQGWEQAERSGA